ncbi:hypothetical protein QX233_03510 [Chryseobacterium gambrini]|uniref:Uncharacterized protein n=2 Tax=Chryseobacterium group TaxID=2782232 RepID=A0AAJ1VIQ9_9FLAO|nr:MULTISPECIES: hypothetical protein [Chryseobacterium]MDN4011523.1 hypothetical protein [Chryseobacterium gambrini]QWA38289.1 hypothetical protein KKI44_20730 [Chryseobacterium sp. ZHDP1]
MNIKKITLILFPIIYMNLMGQQNFKIVETNYNLNDFEAVRKELQNYEFFKQNLNTHKTCTKHKEKSEFRVMADGNKKFFLLFDKEDNALEFLDSTERYDYGILETDLQEELEKITAENIDEKSAEFLARFNKAFKLQVDYDPNESDFSTINEKVKKTVWDKESRFLLNFYMMEVTKRKFNFPNWSFEEVNTFNPFYVPLYVGRDGKPQSYNRLLDPKTRKHFDFKMYLGL